MLGSSCLATPEILKRHMPQNKAMISMILSASYKNAIIFLMLEEKDKKKRISKQSYTSFYLVHMINQMYQSILLFIMNMLHAMVQSFILQFVLISIINSSGDHVLKDPWQVKSISGVRTRPLRILEALNCKKFGAQK
jgi:hypothetical protein